MRILIRQTGLGFLLLCVGYAGADWTICAQEKHGEHQEGDHKHHAVANTSSHSGLPLIEELPWSAGDVELFSQTIQALTSMDPRLKETSGSLSHLLMGHSKSEDPASLQLQRILDPHCLAAVSINPESRVKAAAGPAGRELKAGVWNTFLIRVHNEAGVTAPLRCLSPNAILEPSQSKSFQRWAEVEIVGPPLLREGLSGRALEYRIIRIRTEEVGKREARLIFDVGQGTQDLGFRSNVDLLFEIGP